MRSKTCILLFIMLLPVCIAGMFNEIMYDPEGSDNNREYIELISEVPLSGYLISDGDSEDTLEVVKKSESRFGLIVEEGFNYTGFNCTVYSIGATIGNGLSDQDNISFYDENGTLVDSLFIDGFDAGNNGRSISLFNGSWSESAPTPCRENLAFTQPEEDPAESEAAADISILGILERAYLGQEYDKLFKVVNEAHESGITDNISARVNYSIIFNSTEISNGNFTVLINSYATAGTGTFKPSTSGIFTICGNIIESSINDIILDNDGICYNVTVIDPSTIPCNISINIINDNIFINNSERLSYSISISEDKYPFEITYWIEDLHEIYIKEPVITSNTNSRSFTPSISESDKVIFLKANLSFAACNDSPEGNYDESMLIVKGDLCSSSSIEIEKAYLGADDAVSFGDSFRLRFKANKGISTKSAIKVWVQDSDGKKVSYISSANLYSKCLDTDMTMKIDLKTDCSGKRHDGKYTAVVSGFDTNDTFEIRIEGNKDSMCSKKSPASQKDKSVFTGDDEEYTVSGLKSIYSSDENLSLGLTIFNPEDVPETYDIWSYIYRGSKCYSGVRKENLVSLEIDPEDSSTISLDNRILVQESGEYKLKIKILKGSRKTEDELTEDIIILSETSSQNRGSMQPKIKSFYTLAKKIDGEINLYATTENCDEGMSLVLETPDDQMTADIKEKNKFTVNTKEGKNIYLLSLKEGDDVLDRKEIILHADKDRISSKEDSMTEEIMKVAGPRAENIDASGSGNQITGFASQEFLSSSKKMETAIPYVLASVFAAGIFLFFIKGKRSYPKTL